MGTTLQTLTLQNNSLETYLQAIQRIPLLSAEEERTLANRYREHNDLHAVRQLILANLRFVVYVAKSYSSFGLPQADIIQEGNIGLMKAVKRFNPSFGIRLISFAVHWIKAEIHNFIIRNWRIVKIATTKAQRKLFFNLKKYRKQLGWFTKQEVETIAKDLKVSPKEVLEMESRLEQSDIALEWNQESDEHKHPIPIHYLKENSKNPEQTLIEENQEHSHTEKLNRAFSKLDERSQKILKKRWLTESKATLQELATHYQVSIERIRQIEEAALKKLKIELNLLPSF